MKQQQSFKDQFKCLEDLTTYTTNPNVLDIIKKFTKFKNLILSIISDIEETIKSNLLDSLTPNMFALIQTQTSITSQYLDAFIKELISTDVTINNDKLFQQMKKEVKTVESLKLSYYTTLDKSLEPLKEILMRTKQFIDTQVQYSQPFTLMRLSERDQGIAVETNGLLYDSEQIYVIAIQPKVELVLKGLWQPFLFDGVYFEQPFNCRGEPHKIRYQIHEGFNLRESIYDQTINVFHPEMKQVGEECYLVEFPQQIKLLKGHKYCISSTTDKDESIFATQQYNKQHEQNALVEFQTIDYIETTFILPDNISMVHSYKDCGAFPAIIVQQE